MAEMGIGLGVLRGMGITLQHFFTATVDYLKGTPTRRRENGEVELDPKQQGVFTIQYPEERLKVYENFRFLPVLLVEGEEIRCTSCGICAKVCPPQCIWIVRTTGPDGKPVPEPAEFTIDTSVCMNCGFCAEYCPFDAIKMDHRYELSTYERVNSWIHRKSSGELLVTTDYYARTHPRAWAEEEAARAAEEAKKAARAAAPAAAGAARPAAAAGTAAGTTAERTARPAHPPTAATGPGGGTEKDPGGPAAPPREVASGEKAAEEPTPTSEQLRDAHASSDKPAPVDPTSNTTTIN